MELQKLVGSWFDLESAIASTDVAGIAASSTDVKPGFVFFGLPGVKVDGAAFTKEAEAAGAVAVVVSNGSEAPSVSIPVLRHEDVRRVLAFAAADWFGRQPETIAAVTGTAGKTSVATFLRQIWEQGGVSAASIGTTGVVAPGRDDYGNLTTPDPIALHRLLAELADNSVTHAAMEASSHGLDQRRLDGVKLSVAGFTNLGRDHLDYHKTMGEYLAAKLLLFTERLEAGKPVVIFSDDAYSDQVIAATREAGREALTVGRSGNFIALKKVEHLQTRQVIELEHDGQFYRVEFPLAGDFQVSNGLVAAGMAIAAGLPAKTTFDALENLHGASGRLELIGRTKDGAPAYVDYAHKPEALEHVLQSLRPFTPGRIVLVFGCGGDRDKGKRPIMGEIAARLSDVVIVTDDNPRSENPAAIRADIMAVSGGAKEIGDRAEAIRSAVDLLREGDCLVVAGKGHEQGQIVGDTVLPFSDHQVVGDALKSEAGVAML